MKEISKSTFLKVGAALVTGVVVGDFKASVNVKVNEAIKQATGQRAGNAGTYQKIEVACKDADNKQACFQSYKPSTSDKIIGIVVAPPQEELLYRGIPSAMVSTMEDREDPIADVVSGTGRLGISRCELFVGIGSSVIFGAVHNITDKGIDTQTIPASQTVGGMVYWYLQRKFGIVANTIAHAWNNFKTLI